MANDTMKPGKACFGQIFFSTDYEVGDRAEIDIFKKGKLEDRTIFPVGEDRTPPIMSVEKLDDDMVLLITSYAYYVCYHGFDEKYKYVTVGEVPVVGKTIEVVGCDKARLYNGIYSSILIPEEVNDRFADYDMYIFKADGKIYLCFKR